VATITVELTGVNPTPVTVSWATSDGTATAGSDYGVRNSTTPPSGTLTFPPGGSPMTVRTKTFTVPILQDTIVEGTETVALSLGGPVGAGLVAGRDTATLLIVDDDVGGVVQFSSLLFGATECAALPCNAMLTVSRTAGAASGVTVDFATADGTATSVADYVATSGTVTFGAGQTSQTILIPLQIEPGVEATKSFSVVVGNPGGGATLGVRTTAEVRIADPR
jgi:chitinase